MPEPAKEKARSRFTQMYRAGAFRPVARFISDKSNEEDRLADSVAQVFEMDATYAARGKVLAPALLVPACLLRAIEPGRRFVKTDAQPARDVLDQRNFSNGKVEVHRLDGLLDPDSGSFESEGDRALELALHSRLVEDPTMKLNSAVDLAAWLDTLAAEDVTLLVLRQSGYTLTEIAAATDSSTSKVFSRLKALVNELAERAGLTAAKKPRKPRTPKLSTELDS